TSYQLHHARDAEQRPPCSEGIVPLPQSERGGRRNAPQGVTSSPLSVNPCLDDVRHRNRVLLGQVAGLIQSLLLLGRRQVCDGSGQGRPVQRLAFNRIELRSGSTLARLQQGTNQTQQHQRTKH